MSILSQFLHGGKNPADEAMQYFEQIPGTLHPYYDPYVQTGLDAKDALSDQYSRLMEDPTAFINALMEGYTPSKGYQAKKKEMLGQAANTAAAGGFSGTESDIKQQLGITDDLLSQDMQQFLNNVLGAYQTGLSGEQGLFNTGYDASKDLATSLANVLSSEGSLAFQGQRQQNQNMNDLFKGITGAIGGIAGLPMKGGGSVGTNLVSKWL